MKIFLPAMLLLVACSNPANHKSEIASKVLELERSNTLIHYLEAGSGDTTLLFLHGWNISKEYWSEQLSFFSDKYKIFTLDLPGFGHSKSDRESWTVEEYGLDVAEFIAKLYLDKLVIIGHSMSGAVMLEAALKSEEAIIALVGVDNLKTIGLENPPGWDDQVIEIISQMEADYKPVVKEYASAWLFNSATDSIDKQRVISDYQNANQEVAISSFKSIVNNPNREFLALAKVGVKLNLIQSAGMPTHTAALDTLCKSGYEIIEIQEVGQFPMVEKPDAFNKSLEAILKQI